MDLYSVPGITLMGLWADKDAQTVLHSQRWDYVVLQEQSTLTTDPELIPAMRYAVSKWSGAIRQVGAKPVMYETWARKPGSDWYSDKTKYPTLDLGDPELMQDKIDKATNTIAAENSALVAPIGDYWASCRAQPGMPDLYAPDGSHPSMAGDYLIALLFYRVLTGHKPTNVTHVPRGISPEQAHLLIKCASHGS